MGIYEELVARGLIAQVTNEEEIREMVNNGKATFYIGFDCTADSLHVGHFMALCLMKRLQMAGNKPIALIGGAACKCPEDFVTIAETLDRAAKEVGVNFIGGYSALVSKGMTKSDENLIRSIPQALARTERVCSSVNVGSTRTGINMDAVRLCGEMVKATAEATKEHDSFGCAKLVIFCNAPDDNPFMAGAFLGVTEADAVINVGVSGPGVVKKALEKVRGKGFEHLPGQCAILSVPGKGEAIFSITSSPTNEKYMEFSIKRCGSITNFLHFDIEPGQQIAVRGPYGNHFPVEDKLKGKDLLFIAGGIGLAPLRSVINYMLDKRDDYGSIDVVYGARSKEDFVRYDELTNVWPVQKDTRVHLTIDRAQEGWTGNVGFVPNFLKDLKFTPDKTVLLCGPPIMIKLCLAALIEMGFEKKQVYTTLELRMKCGVGKCGRCNIGKKYVCKDGPVFTCDELDEIPDEY